MDKPTCFWPHLVFYTDKLRPGVGGDARGFVVRIANDYKNDAGIHAHEYQHVRKWWQVGMASFALILFILLALGVPQSIAFGLALFGFSVDKVLYYFNRHYRMKSEVAAYREQMMYPDKNGYFLTAHSAASRLCLPSYRLNLSQEEAKTLILDGF